MESFAPFIDTAMHYASIGFSLTGAAFIIFGGLRTLVHCVLHFSTLADALMAIRLQLGHMIILGLEFIVAGDILETIITPSYQRLGILSILVVIRTLLSYFLGKELKDLSVDAKKAVMS